MMPEFRLITTILLFVLKHEVCVLLRCKKANGCYCVVARAFIVLVQTDDVCGDTPVTSWNPPVSYVTTSTSGTKRPLVAVSKEMRECQSLEVISCFFDANQVSSSLRPLSVMIPTPSRLGIPSRLESLPNFL